MTEYNIDVYDPLIEVYNFVFAHIILWMPLVIFLFILIAELVRLKASYLQKYLVNYKEHCLMDSYGFVYKTGKHIPGSMTVEPNGYQEQEGVKNNKWYIRMLKLTVLLSFLLPFYGYYVSEYFAMSHVGMLLYFSIIFIIREFNVLN